jgi:hypothetical protein
MRRFCSQKISIQVLERTCRPLHGLAGLSNGEPHQVGMPDRLAQVVSRLRCEHVPGIAENGELLKPVRELKRRRILHLPNSRIVPPQSGTGQPISPS